MKIENKSIWNLEGKRFGRLQITGLHPREDPSDLTPYTIWMADCDCGTRDYQVRARSMRYAHRLGCGCVHKEAVSHSNATRSNNAED